MKDANIYTIKHLRQHGIDMKDCWVFLMVHGLKCLISQSELDLTDTSSRAKDTPVSLAVKWELRAEDGHIVERAFVVFSLHHVGSVRLGKSLEKKKFWWWRFPFFDVACYCGVTGGFVVPWSSAQRNNFNLVWLDHSSLSLEFIKCVNSLGFSLTINRVT